MLAKSVQYTPENRKGVFKKKIYLEQPTKFKETLWNSENVALLKSALKNHFKNNLFINKKSIYFPKYSTTV